MRKSTTHRVKINIRVSEVVSGYGHRRWRARVYRLPIIQTGVDIRATHAVRCLKNNIRTATARPNGESERSHVATATSITPAVNSALQRVADGRIVE
jgi:hypothetical protein